MPTNLLIQPITFKVAYDSYTVDFGEILAFEHDDLVSYMKYLTEIFAALSVHRNTAQRHVAVLKHKLALILSKSEIEIRSAYAAENERAVNSAIYSHQHDPKKYPDIIKLEREIIEAEFEYNKAKSACDSMWFLVDVLRKKREENDRE